MRVVLQGSEVEVLLLRASASSPVLVMMACPLATITD